MDAGGSPAQRYAPTATKARPFTGGRPSRIGTNMDQQLQQLRSRPHLSASQLKTFQLCPRKYFLAYVDRVEPAFRPVAFAFGTAWHHTVGRWLLGEAAEPALADHFRLTLHDELSRDGPPVLFDDGEDEVSLAALGDRMLRAFVGDVPPPEHVLEVELPFSMDLADSTTGDVLPVPLIGAVDAVVIEGGRPAIWELKTAKRKWSANQLEFDMQATVYHLAAAQSDYSDATVKMVVTTKSSKPAVQVAALRRGPGDARDVVATAKSLLRAVEAGVDHPVRGWQCRTCQYAGHCR